VSTGWWRQVLGTVRENNVNSGDTARPVIAAKNAPRRNVIAQEASVAPSVTPGYFVLFVCDLFMFRPEVYSSPTAPRVPANTICGGMFMSIGETRPHPSSGEPANKVQCVSNAAVERSVWSTLLCKWSAVLDAMLQSEMQEGSGRGRIEIEDFSHEVIELGVLPAYVVA
jgi:hypothetical protein